MCQRNGNCGVAANVACAISPGPRCAVHFILDRRIREDFVPIVKKAKGLVRYYPLDTGKGEGASVSVFKDKAGADESVRLAADYVKEHLSKFITQKPEIIQGPIKAHD
jgi:hypothetical protein